MPLRAAFAILIAALLLASCGLGAATVVPQENPVPTVTDSSRSEEIRFALIGNVDLTNAWAYYDEAGADYNNRAVQANFWPSLYRLSIPGGEFESYLADGWPSEFEQENGFYAATVKLNPDLVWSNHSHLTANDVAFTINTALAFQFGLDWRSAYNPSILDHAIAVDDLTVRFYFKSQPAVADWQYGVLQGPVLSQVYWEQKIDGLAGLLPSAELEQSIRDLQIEADIVRIDLNELTISLSLVDQTSKEHDKLQTQIDKKQAELNYLNSEIARLENEREVVLADARAAVYSLGAVDEPTFGPFMPDVREAGEYIDVADPSYPFDAPNFDRAVYHVFANEQEAAAALQEDAVDIILNPQGLPADSIDQLSDKGITILNHPTSSARFLVFNQSNSYLANDVFRRAVSCVIDSTSFSWGEDFMDFRSFVPSDNLFWSNAQAQRPCAGLDPQSSFEQMIDILKSGGYGWDKEPSADLSRPGLTIISSSSLKLPNGEVFPSVGLLVSSSNPIQQEFAWNFVDRLSALGIEVDLRLATPQDINYAVYSSGQYDLAILGWRLSEYPGYLCEWFEAPSPFAYNGDRLKSACEAMTATSDLEAARQASFEVQSALMEDLPFIPLYASITVDAYRNVRYPFGIILNGISSLYGAPWLAMPAVP